MYTIIFKFRIPAIGIWILFSRQNGVVDTHQNYADLVKRHQRDLIMEEHYRIAAVDTFNYDYGVQCGQNQLISTHIIQMCSIRAQLQKIYTLLLGSYFLKRDDMNVASVSNVQYHMYLRLYPFVYEGYHFHSTRNHAM